MITTTYYNSLKSHKKIFAVLFCLLFFIYTAFTYPYFTGTIGIGGKIQPEPEKFPQVLMDSYFAGQFDLSKNLFLRTSFSMYTTESIFKDITFKNTESIFSLDEISLTYLGSFGQISHLLGIHLGEYEPVGSDVFLQRQFGIPSFASRLTESICGISRAKIYDMSGIGGSYVVKLPKNIAVGTSIYYNKTENFETPEEDDISESFNTDFRFASAGRIGAIDLTFGLTMPMKREIVHDNGDTQKVILLIERADMHAGLTAFLGSSNSSSLLFQAGFTKLIIDPSEENDEKVLSLNDVYILVEPRFVSKSMCISLSLFNMPKETRENLFYVENPVGISLSLYTPWISLSGKKSQFGLMTTVSSSDSLDKIIIQQEAEQSNEEKMSNLGLHISPYGIIYLGGGKLNFSLNVNAFNIKDFDTFLDNISLIAGYKVAL